jgi:hypothetical protein
MCSAANRQLVLGAVMAAGGASALAFGAWGAGAGLILVSGVFILSGRLLRVSGNAVPAVNTAFNAALEGRLGDAERLLDEVEATRPIRYVQRVADLQRANIALRRGDLDAAAAKLDAAVKQPPGILTGREERMHVLGAHALRALVFASKGDAERARADIAVVRGSPLSTADSLARAAVAEAIVLDRTGDRDALAAHLAGERRLLLDYTAPRERAVVRAYQRMLRAPRTSVYRQAAPREPERDAHEEPPLADWIARIAPAAAPFVRVARTAADEAAAPVEEKEVEPGLVKLAAERVAGKGAKAPAPRTGKVVVLWAALVLFFLVLWQSLTLPDTRAALGPASDGPPEVATSTVLSGVVLIFVAVFAALVWRNVRIERRLAAALGTLGRGDERAAAAEFEALTRGPFPLVAAHAHLSLARLAERRADFEAALAHCDAGIGKASAQPTTRAIASTMLLPDLVAERAFVLAATDRRDKARAEMEVLAEQFPAYPFRAPAELRVKLVERARLGDLEGAARIVDARKEDVPLPLRDETLADLVRVTARPEAAGAGEAERLKEELRLDADVRGWIEAVAPAILAAFARAGDEAAERDAEAEREALAEEEAAAPRARVG